MGGSLIPKKGGGQGGVPEKYNTSLRGNNLRAEMLKGLRFSDGSGEGPSWRLFFSYLLNNLIRIRMKYQKYLNTGTVHNSVMYAY